MCRDCRRVQPREEKCKTCGSICPRGAGYYVRTTCSPECRTRTAGPCSECGEVTDKQPTKVGRLCPPCAVYRKWLKERVRLKTKSGFRATVYAEGDLTKRQVRDLLLAATNCPMPGCGVIMVDKPFLPASKELDHRVPIAAGGTHTLSNVRIICRKCNRARPLDGSDL